MFWYFNPKTLNIDIQNSIKKTKRYFWCEIKTPSRRQQLTVMPSSHSTILAWFFTRRQVLINRGQMPDIGGKSVLVTRQSRCVNDQRHDLRSSLMHRRHPLNIWHAKYLELSAIHSPAVWMSSDWKIHQWWPPANERARYRVTGSSGRRSLLSLHSD